MLGMAAVAEPMIITLIGEKWLPSVEFLQLLCFVGMMYPLHALNLNILKVTGRSDLFLKLEVLKKILVVPIVILGILYGIKILLLGMIVNSFVAYYINSFWSGRLIGYSVKAQVKDVLPSFLLALGVSSIVFLMTFLTIWPSSLVLLIAQITVACIITIGFCEATRFRDYMYIKQILYEKFKKNT
jgi:O-antigen/teichoic acid export membrane protein